MGVVPDDEMVDEPGEAFPAESEISGDDLTMLLLGVPERISDLLIGLSSEQLRYRHGPAFPTAGEVARHLAAAGGRLDSEITGIALGTPPAEAAPEDDRPLEEVLPDWQRRRRRAADLLRGLPAERWEGELRDVCERGLQHELGHLSQLRNLTALIPVA